MVDEQEKVVDMVFKQKLEQQAQIKRNKRRRIRRRLTRFSILVVLLSFYLFTELSKPKVILITGNKLISKEEITEVAEVSLDKYLFLSNGLFVKHKLLNHPLIAEASVKTSLLKRTININVSELDVFGYRYIDGGIRMIMKDGSYSELTDTLYHYLPYMIYINGFEAVDDEQRLVASFADVDDSILAQISEIHQTSVSYDDKLLEIIMNDGNKVYTSFQTVDQMNHYFSIVPQLAKENRCIMIDELSGKLYSQKCIEQ